MASVPFRDFLKSTVYQFYYLIFPHLTFLSYLCAQNEITPCLKTELLAQSLVY